jgi:exopolysaccharide biosynthesis polyprenyl glycosylphosphotransferase
MPVEATTSAHVSADTVQEVDARAVGTGSAWLASAAIIPAVDALALAAAVAIGHTLDHRGIIFIGLALIMLNAGSWRFPRINPRIGTDLGWLLTRIAIVSLVVLALTGDLDDTAILATGAVAAALLVPGRAIAYAALRAARRRGRGERTVIVGAGPIAGLLAKVCSEHPEFGLVPIGVLDDAREPRIRLPLLGGPQDLPRVVREREVRRVIIAFGTARETELIDTLRAAEEVPIAVHCIPRFFELRVPREHARTDDIWGIPLTRLSVAGARMPERVAKRALDVAFASVSVLLFSPILAMIAIAVRASSKGPILFRQERVGQGGTIFELLKFRSMRVNDDSDIEWSVANDGRVTRVGRFLRRTSLDEVPQLFNILRGDMSLVGPRPERPYFVQKFAEEIPRYLDRLRVPAGLTGWAQVHGLRGDTSILERVRFDNAYIENWSLWLDLVIVARTSHETLMGGERRARRHDARRALDSAIEAEALDAQEPSESSARRADLM